MNWAGIWGRFGVSRIVVYADFIDPFCYIGFHNVMRVAEANRIPLEWHGFELNPATPPEGALLQTADNSDLRFGMWSSVQDFAKKSGLDLKEPLMVPNTRLAQLWVHSVKNADVKKSLIERIYQAYLSDKMDIGCVAVLADLAVELGLPAQMISDLAAKREGNALERYRQEAIGLQFPGMPGFKFKGRTHFGALSESAWNDIIHKESPCSTR